ncbi:MAG: Zn-ribbon domain-containing OB-fold protein [Thermoplasmata archaeon]
MMHDVYAYMENLKAGKIIGFECSECHNKWVTILNYCPVCGSENINDSELSTSGKVLTFTIQKVPPTQYQGKAPYAIAIIQLDDGAKVQARIENLNGILDLVGKEVIFDKGGEEGLVFKIKKDNLI